MRIHTPIVSLHALAQTFRRRWWLACTGLAAIVAAGSFAPAASAFTNPGPAAHSVTVSCASADGTWHKTDVTIACTAYDHNTLMVGVPPRPITATTTLSSFTLSTNVATGTETSNALTNTRVICDSADACATAGPITGNKIDKAAPSWSCDPYPSYPDQQFWSNADVSVACTISDGGSGLANPGAYPYCSDTSANPALCAFQLTTSVPAGVETNMATTNSRTVCDKLGNCTTVGPIGGQWVDKKAPDWYCTPFDTTATYKTNVTISCIATDGGSWIASDNGVLIEADNGYGPVPSWTFQLTTNVPAGTKTDNASTNSHVICDRAGNCVTAGPITGINIDRSGQ